jgi:hypothetical protein
LPSPRVPSPRSRAFSAPTSPPVPANPEARTPANLEPTLANQEHDPANPKTASGNRVNPANQQ